MTTKQGHSNTCDLVGYRQGYNAPPECSCGFDNQVGCASVTTERSESSGHTPERSAKENSSLPDTGVRREENDQKDHGAALLPADPLASPPTTETLPNTGNDLAVVMRAIRPLDSGALHCRYCPAGSNNQWQHAEHCIYAESVKDAEQARQVIASLRVQMATRTVHGGNVASGTPFYLQPGQREPEYDQGHSVVVWYDDLYDLADRLVKAEADLAALRSSPHDEMCHCGHFRDWHFYGSQSCFACGGKCDCARFDRQIGSGTQASSAERAEATRRSESAQEQASSDPPVIGAQQETKEDEDLGG